MFPPNSELTEVINACQSVLTFSHGKDTCSGVSSYRRLALGKRQVPQVCLDIGKKLDQKKKTNKLQRAHGDLMNVHKYPRGDAVRSGSCQCCPGPEQGAPGKNWSPGGSPWAPEAVLCLRGHSPGTGCAERCWGPSWRAPAAAWTWAGHQLGVALLGGAGPEAPRGAIARAF